MGTLFGPCIAGHFLMERREVDIKYKGAAWHQYFACHGKKDSTFSSILEEKTRYYKLYYPFLQKKQILGKVYEELEIPHTFGIVDRNRLYKLYLNEKKNNEKASHRRNMLGKLPFTIKQKTASQIRIKTTLNSKSKLQTKVTENDKLTPKCQKTVRFEDDIQIYNISREEARFGLPKSGTVPDVEQGDSSGQPASSSNEANSQGITSPDESGNLSNNISTRTSLTPEASSDKNKIFLNENLDDTEEITSDKQDSLEEAEIEKDVDNVPLNTHTQLSEAGPEGSHESSFRRKSSHVTENPIVIRNKNINSDISENMTDVLSSPPETQPTSMGRELSEAKNKSKKHVNNIKQDNKIAKTDYTEDNMKNSDTNLIENPFNAPICEVINVSTLPVNSAEIPLQNNESDEALTDQFNPLVHSTTKILKKNVIKIPQKPECEITEKLSEAGIEGKILERNNYNEEDICSSVSCIEQCNYVELIHRPIGKEKPLTFSTVFHSPHSDNSKIHDWLNSVSMYEKTEKPIFSNNSVSECSLWSSSLFDKDCINDMNLTTEYPKEKYNDQGDVSQTSILKMSKIAQSRDSDSSSQYTSYESSHDLSDGSEIIENSLTTAYIDILGEKLDKISVKEVKANTSIESEKNTSQGSFNKIVDNIQNKNHISENIDHNRKHEGKIEQSSVVTHLANFNKDTYVQGKDVRIKSSVVELEKEHAFSNSSSEVLDQTFDRYDVSVKNPQLGDREEKKEFQQYQSPAERSFISMQKESDDSSDYSEPYEDEIKNEEVKRISNNSPISVSGEISTAYETDSESGKLKLNRFLPKIKTEFLIKQEASEIEQYDKEFDNFNKMKISQYQVVENQNNNQKIDPTENKQCNEGYIAGNYNEDEKQGLKEPKLSSSSYDSTDLSEGEDLFNSNKQNKPEVLNKQKNKLFEIQSTLNVGLKGINKNVNNSDARIKINESVKTDYISKHFVDEKYYDKEKYSKSDIYKSLVYDELKLLSKANGQKPTSRRHLIENWLHQINVKENLDFKTEDNYQNTSKSVKKGKTSDLIRSPNYQSSPEMKYSEDNLSICSASDETPQPCGLEESNNNNLINLPLIRAKQHNVSSNTFPLTMHRQEPKYFQTKREQTVKNLPETPQDLSTSALDTNSARKKRPKTRKIVRKRISSLLDSSEDSSSEENFSIKNSQSNQIIKYSAQKSCKSLPIKRCGDNLSSNKQEFPIKKCKMNNNIPTNDKSTHLLAENDELNTTLGLSKEKPPSDNELVRIKMNPNNFKDEESSISNDKQKYNSEKHLHRSSINTPPKKLTSLVSIRKRSSYFMQNVSSSQQKELDKSLTELSDVVSKVYNSQTELENNSQNRILNSLRVESCSKTTLKKELHQTWPNLNKEKSGRPVKQSKKSITSFSKENLREKIQSELNPNSTLSKGDVDIENIPNYESNSTTSSKDDTDIENNSNYESDITSSSKADAGIENIPNYKSNSASNQQIENTNTHTDCTVNINSKEIDQILYKGIISTDNSSNIKMINKTKQVGSHVTSIICHESNSSQLDESICSADCVKKHLKTCDQAEASSPEPKRTKATCACKDKTQMTQDGLYGSQQESPNKEILRRRAYFMNN